MKTPAVKLAGGIGDEPVGAPMRRTWPGRANGGRSGNDDRVQTFTTEGEDRADGSPRPGVTTVMHPGLVLRATDEAGHGIATRTLQRLARVDDGPFEHVHRGRYIGRTDEPHQRWLLRLNAHLDRGGPMSAISHRAAARLHGLDGFASRPVRGNQPEDIIVGSSSTWRTSPAIRADLTAHQVTGVDGLRVTTVARTLLDVGRFADADTVELALQHALRGNDQRRPDLWNEPLLLALQTAAANGRVPKSLRIAIARQGVQRPTGSYAETITGQGHREAGGVELLRQPSVEIRLPNGRVHRRYFPDFADFLRGLLIEIDGRAGHEGDDNVDRDDQRQNLLVAGFRVLRFHARRVLADPVEVGRTIERVRATLPLRMSPHAEPGVVVTWSGNAATITLARRP